MSRLYQKTVAKSPLKAHKHVQCRRHPVKETRPPEPERYKPQKVREQVIWLAVPAICGTANNPAHAVYAQARTRKPTAASNKNAVTTSRKTPIRRTAWNMTYLMIWVRPCSILAGIGGAASCLKPAHHALKAFPNSEKPLLLSMRAICTVPQAKSLKAFNIYSPSGVAMPI